MLLAAGLLMTKYGPPLIQWFLQMESQKTQATLQPMLDGLLITTPLPTP